jgi:MFS family permease
LFYDFFHKGVSIKIILALAAFAFCIGIVGGIWLALLGFWGLIIIGMVLSLVMPYAYLILSLPKIRTIPRLIRHLENEKKRSVVLLGFINVLFDYTLIALWVLIILGLFIDTNRISSYGLIPFLLFGYAVLMAPLVYMASKEHPSSIGSVGGLLFALFGFGGLTVCQCVAAPFAVAVLILLSLVIAFSTVQMTLVSIHN